MLFLNNFWGLILINALTFAMSLFSFGDFFKMREAYVHMQEHHVIQTILLVLACY